MIYIRVRICGFLVMRAIGVVGLGGSAIGVVGLGLVGNGGRSRCSIGVVGLGAIKGWTNLRAPGTQLTLPNSKR